MITEELKKRVADFVEMEYRSGSMQLITSGLRRSLHADCRGRYR